VDWERAGARAGHSSLHILGGLLLSPLRWRESASAWRRLARAATPSHLGNIRGSVLIAAMLALAAIAVWSGVVETFHGLQFQAANDAVLRQAMLIRARWASGC
jgi:predicted membrane protein